MKDKDFKLALVRYVYNNLGYKVTGDSDAFDKIAERLKGNQLASHKGEQTRWFDVGMRVFVKNQDSVLSETKYRKLDSNIRNYLSDLNDNRDSPLKLRYYQYLSVLFTEFVLDQHNRDVLVDNFNTFIDEEFWQFEENVLHLSEFSKLAYWMATGSGKTHIMHINMLQVVEYFDENQYDNMILIAPNEQIAYQHMDELGANGLPYESIDDDSDNFNKIKVTDINKLKKGESGPKTVDVEEFGQQNIIFVDEGHKGLGSLSGGSSSGWVEKRDYLIGSTRDGSNINRNGFAFEYSATFASSLNDAKGYQEYSRSIIVDYPYGRFHEDGYGKDYNILNINPDGEYADIVKDERDKWLLSNLLSYYEKLRIFEDEEDIVDDNNIERPLSVFVGNSVNAVNRGTSDVQTIVEFLSKIIDNENNWVTSVINSILSKENQYADGGLFDDRFDYIRKNANSADQLYKNLLTTLFDSKDPSKLEVVRLKNLDDEEVALTTDTTESYFGVVTVGDTKDFYDLIEDSENHIKTTENEIHSTSLFDRIDSKNSSVDILIGSKKFAEGWDSTRPSTLGLLNLGRSEGPLVVQMFGRGVRVNGKNKNGKRASMKNIQQSKKFQISRLETLDVFGIRAEYIETFREHLEKERTEINDVKTVSVDVNKPTTDSDLKVPKFEKDTAEDEIPIVSLDKIIKEDKMNALLNVESDEEYIPDKPYLKIQTSGSRLSVEGKREYESKKKQYKVEDFEIDIDSLDINIENKNAKLQLLDWDDIWQSSIRYKNDRGYDEIVIEKSAVSKFFKQGNYELYLPSGTMVLKSLDDLERIESICTQLISNYLDNIYSEMKRSVEYQKVRLDDLDEDWIKNNLPSSYDVQVKNPDENDEIVEELKNIKTDDLKSTKEDEMSNLTKELFKYLEQIYIPVLLDSDAFNDRGSEKKYKEKIESISPEGIDNMGEKKFIDSLEHHISDGMLEDYETIVMRNQANKGVRIPQVDGNFYPDFVIWISKDDTQHIILADPHGMVQGGKKSDLDAMIKVNEDKESEDDEVEIHSCLFARTKNNGNSLEKAKETVAEENDMDKSELRKKYIYFVDEIADDLGQTNDEVENMLEDFLGL